MDYRDLEQSLRSEAAAVESAAEGWTAERVASRLREIADAINHLRREPAGGVDASMGKRSGRTIDI
jgi:hypothetical protein